MDTQASSDLAAIYAPIELEMDRLREFLAVEFTAQDSLIHDLLDHVAKFRGKQLRPALLFLAGRLGGAWANETSAPHVRIAAVVELIHTATLVHDDILDAALVRRQIETVHRRWGERAAVLIGDYIYSRAFHLSTQVEGMAEVLSETTNTICEGELLQLRSRFNPDLGEERYFEIIQKKTAVLYAVSCRLGGALGGLPDATCRELERVGLDLGIAFQIVDDCLDYAGREVEAGKSLGTDLHQNKITLPLIYLLDGLAAPRRARLKEDLERPLNAEREQEICRLVHEHGALAESLSRADAFVESARTRLERLTADAPAEIRESFELLSDYILRRQR